MYEIVFIELLKMYTVYTGIKNAAPVKVLFVF